jgi:hypothetical protein
MAVDTTDGRLGLLEQKGAVMAQQISDISRTLDRVVPYGESLVELRGMLNGLKEDVDNVRDDLAAMRAAASEIEKQRRVEHRADRRIWWSIVAGLVTMLIAAGIGIFVA